jgi:periplasmic glucans biosynthesis protein
MRSCLRKPAVIAVVLLASLLLSQNQATNEAASPATNPPSSQATDQPTGPSANPPSGPTANQTPGPTPDQPPAPTPNQPPGPATSPPVPAPNPAPATTPPANQGQPPPAKAPTRTPSAGAAAAQSHAASQPRPAQPRPSKPSPSQSPPSKAPASPAPAFGFANVRLLAKERASHEFRPRSQTLPASLANLTYDQYRDIRFRPGSALWRGQAMFEVQFFHRGYNIRQRVNIYDIDGGEPVEIEYNPRAFTYGRLVKAPKAPANLGYAGFRVHYPLQTPAYKDELLVFLGASYFRVLGRNQHYGASARGLAIDTGLPTGEEFPTFTDFWLVRPQPTDRALTIYALLDSRSVAGAYRFDIRPGEITQVEVHCELYPRRAIAKLGVAPLTSMFFFGEDDGSRRFDDYRPQVHDSDGLMSETGQGQWLWRPLANPRELRVNRFIDENPHGFGLVQRERSFVHYQDAEAQYETRPSYWIQPLGNWGKGGVELVEIPSDEEIHDNIVAYWVPAQSPVVGKPIAFAYLLSAFAENPRWPPGGRVVATRSSNPATGDNKGHFGPGARRILVDFAGGELDGLASAQPVKAELNTENGQIEAMTVQHVPESKVWRVTFVLTPKPKRTSVDMHCYLTLYGEVLTETWVYQWTP